MNIINFEDINQNILDIRDEKVLLDRDLATLYGVETRDINKAVKNNLDKFPEGYLFELTKKEFEVLRGKFSTAKFAKTRTLPKVFTERGLYMLATILKSKQATQTTLSIIEAFYKLKTLSSTLKQLPEAQTKAQQQVLMQKSGELIADILDDSLETDESETTIELNLAVLKFKHTIKKKKNKKDGE